MTRYPKYSTTVIGAQVRRRPGLKVLLTTGNTRNAVVHHGRLDRGVQMIGKPFSFDDLSGKVRALLDLARA